MALIDAHLHQWDPAAVAYPWLADAPAELAGPFTVDQVEPHLLDSGVTGAILIQAADSAQDNAAMLAAAKAHPWIVGVVAWAPLDEPAALERTLAELAGQPLVRGVRMLIHDRPDADFIVSDAAAAGLDALAAAGLAFDFVTSSPAALAHVPALAARHPDLTIVIDHLGKPPLGASDGALGEWSTLIGDAARYPRVYAKLSGLYATGPDASAWTRRQLRRVIDVAASRFGPERLMLGSDWPVCEIAGGRARVWDALVAEVDMWPFAQREAVRWQTATRAYGLAAGKMDRHEEDSS